MHYNEIMLDKQKNVEKLASIILLPVVYSRAKLWYNMVTLIRYGQQIMDSIILNDRYKLDAVIGEGGMATTYRGQDLLLDRTVAIKIMREQYASDSEFVQRFRHEAQAAARVQNENIAGVYDTGFDKGSYYLVMEYVEGTDLKQKLRANAGPLPLINALSIAEQIASGLEVAHKAGLIHRDIKPHNILINNEGKVKITDFGIARIDSDTEDTGIIVGSVHYISPEQVKGALATEAADIYSLGAVMYEMLTGKTLFEGDTAMSIAQKQVNDIPTPITAINPAVPKEIEDIVNRALEKEPRFRYLNAGEFAATIKRAIVKLSAENTIIIGKREESIDHTMIIERPPTTPPQRQKKTEKEEEPEKEQKNNAAITAIIVITLLLVGSIAAYIFLFYNNSKQQAPPTSNDVKASVPYLVGENVADAKAELVKLGLEVAVEEEYSDTAEKGIVLSQVPRAETDVNTGSVVKLVVSKGAELFAVPDVTGQTLEKAKEILKSNGFELTIKTAKEPNNNVVLGTVSRTDPPADVTVPRKGTMTIYIAEEIPIKKATFSTTAPVFGELEKYYIRIELINDDDSVVILRDKAQVSVGEKINETFDKPEGANVMIRVKAGTTADNINEVIEETNIH